MKTSKGYATDVREDESFRRPVMFRVYGKKNGSPYAGYTTITAKSLKEVEEWLGEDYVIYSIYRNFS